MSLNTTTTTTTTNLLLLLVILIVQFILPIEGGVQHSSSRSSPSQHSSSSLSAQSSWRSIKGLTTPLRGGGATNSRSSRSNLQPIGKQHLSTTKNGNGKNETFRIGLIYFKLPSFLLKKPTSTATTLNKNVLKGQALTWKQKFHLVWFRIRCFCFEPDTIQPANRFISHVLYWLTAWDAVNSVRLNKYVDYPNIPQQLYAGPDGTNKRFLSYNAAKKTIDGKKVLNDVYSVIFYFAQLRPRLLYSVGALLRALQLCTPIQKVIDPTAGVGAGINICAIIAGSRWIKPLILGWTTTKSLWIYLGATNLHLGGYVPITLTIAGSPSGNSAPKPTQPTYSLGY